MRGYGKILSLKVPFVDLLRENEKLKRVLLEEFEVGLTESNFILGPSLDEFEDKFADFVGSKYVIGVANGTDAIEIALRAHELPAGSTAVVPAMTFAASAIGVVRAGLKPVFVDVDEKYGLIDIDLTEDLLKRGAKVVIAVHLYGQAANVNKINEFAELYNAIVIGDASQAHGAQSMGQKLGVTNSTSTYSFYPTKNLGALGDAGAIATNDAHIAEKCISIRNYGSSKKYFHESYGFNSRLDEIQAKFLSAKLNELNVTNALRREAAAFYLRELSNIKNLTLPSTAEFNEHVWHLFPIRHKNRDLLAEKLNDLGIGTAIHYPVALPDQGVYAGSEYFYSKNSWARDWAQNELSLPMHPYLTQQELLHVVESVKQVCSELD